MAAGLLAAEGHLSYPAVAAVAAAGAFAGDGTFFLLGRRGRRIRCPFRSARRSAAAAGRLFERHPRVTLVGYRFVYGLRGAIPYLLGASRFPAARFLSLSAVGAALWALVQLGALHGLVRWWSSDGPSLRWLPPAGAAVAVAVWIGFVRLRRERRGGALPPRRERAPVPRPPPAG